MGQPEPDPPQRPRRLLRWLRRASWLVLALALLYLAAVGTGAMNPSVPFDVLLNMDRFARRPELVAPDDGRTRLVVLVHGLWRSAAAMGKLEDALDQHGYAVLNRSYPSTSGTLEEHAAALHELLEAELAGMRRPPDEIAFVGHSMGGLVVQAYLARTDAREPTACVYIATPHRGAILADLRKDWFWFRMLMGEEAAFQLSPGHPFHSRKIPIPCPTGTVIGGQGDDRGLHPTIPGDDDGTVAVQEAHLAGETDSIVLPVGHTLITVDDRAIRQVLEFLRFHRFAH